MNWRLLNTISSDPSKCFPPPDKKIYVLFDSGYHGSFPFIAKGMMHWYEPGKHEFLMCHTDDNGNDFYVKADILSHYMYVAWKPVCGDIL